MAAMQKKMARVMDAVRRQTTVIKDISFVFSDFHLLRARAINRL
jgi:hypothetical protein